MQHKVNGGASTWRTPHVLSFSSFLDHYPPAIETMEEKTSIQQTRRASQDAVHEGLASEDDAAVLAKLGYKQELRR